MDYFYSPWRHSSSYSIYCIYIFPMILDSVFLCQSLSFSLCQGIGLLTLWEPNSGNKKRWGYWFNWLTPDNHQIKIFTIMTLKNIPPCNKDHSQIKSSQFLFSQDWTFCSLESNILCIKLYFWCHRCWQLTEHL